MKPVLHFEVDQSKKYSVEEARNVQHTISTLRERFPDYDIMVSPIHLKKGGINIYVDVNTTSEAAIREVGNEIIQHKFAFHRKYIPRDVYRILDYDGDLSVPPLDAMRDWWMPIIEMVNFSIHQWNERVLEILISQDINPLQVESIKDTNSTDGIEITMNDLVPDTDNNDEDVPISLLSYIHWMLRKINTSNVPAIDIYQLIKCAGCNPWLVVSCKDTDGGFPFQILDEGVIIKHSDWGNPNNEAYLLAAKKRKETIRRIKESEAKQ